MIFRLVPRSHRSSVLPAYLSYSARNDCEAAPAAILTLVCVLSLCVCVCMCVCLCVGVYVVTTCATDCGVAATTQRCQQN